MVDIIFLEPVLKKTIWGGNRLKEEFHYFSDSENIGECWGISAHSNGNCTVKAGPFKGVKLDRLYSEHRELFGNIENDIFPLLVKIIDAKEKLSIQVHPDDEYAAKNENGSLGKYECWYILDCPKDAKLVIGHKANTRKEFIEYVKNNQYDDLIDYVSIQKGDFIAIEPGTIHAITEGVMLLETQQSSDITYRVYDYNRMVDNKPRELHVQQSIDVVKIPDPAYKKEIKQCLHSAFNKIELLMQCDFFKVAKLVTDVEYEFSTLDENNCFYKALFLLVSVIDGEGFINGNKIKKGDHFILPNGVTEVSLKGNMEMIVSTV